MNEVDKLRYKLMEILSSHDIDFNQLNSLDAKKFDILNSIFKEETGNSINQLLRLINSRDLSENGFIFDEEMSSVWGVKYKQCNEILSKYNVNFEIYDFYSINEICIYVPEEFPNELKSKLVGINLPDFLSILLIFLDEDFNPSGKFEYLL